MDGGLAEFRPSEMCDWQMRTIRKVGGQFGERSWLSGSMLGMRGQPLVTG